MMKNPLLMLFGVTGDLTKRKIIPALFRLHQRTTQRFPIVCIGRRELTTKQFIEQLQIPFDELSISQKKAFTDRIVYYRIDFSNPDCKALNQFIIGHHKQHTCDGLISFLATPPELFIPIIDILACAQLTGKSSRIAFEKPFGSDVKTAQMLQKHVSKHFTEQQIYRIDHYLGKELVQNILMLRFSNILFEQLWNAKFIDHIQITVSETLGIGSRGPYYEQSGAIRDMVQNHLLEVLALVGMEPPESLEPHAIRSKKIELLKSLQTPNKGDIVIGQYASSIIDGHVIPGYREEPGVSSGSCVETFVALKVLINNKRWKGVPIFIRTGKRMSSSYAEVNVVFKNVGCPLFTDQNGVCSAMNNILSIRIQPDAAIGLRCNSKVPGSTALEQATMNYCHHCHHALSTPQAYEVLIDSLLGGHQGSFTHWGEVQASWQYVDAIRCLLPECRFPNYPAGQDGPQSSNALLGKDREWIQFRHSPN